MRFVSTQHSAQRKARGEKESTDNQSNLFSHGPKSHYGKSYRWNDIESTLKGAMVDPDDVPGTEYRHAEALAKRPGLFTQRKPA